MRRTRHGGDASHRPAAVGDRASARRGHSHQLFRPCEHLGRRAAAAAGVRPDAGRSGIAVQRLLLVLRHPADPSRNRARPARRDDGEPDWRVPVGPRFGNGRVRQRFRLHLRSARPAWSGGSAGLPGQFQGDRLLVPAKRAREGDRDLRRRGEILQRHRRAAGGGRRRHIRLALGLWHHGDPQLRLFSRLLVHLSRPKRGATAEGESEASPIGMLGYLLRNRKVWGLTIGFAAYGYSFYLFLTWLPGYLVSEMHMSIIKSAGYAAIPWLFATISDLVVGGWLIDHLLAKGYDDTKTRKTVLVGGMVLGLAVFGATMTTSPVWAIFWISIALSGLAAAAPVGWSIPSLIAPTGGTGTIGGVRNFFNNLMGAVAPVVTGFVVGASNSLSLAFLAAGVVLLIGIFFFVVVLGKIEPIPEPDTGAAALSPA